MSISAEILAVGTELLLGDIANTNAQFISRELAKLGIPVYGHAVVGDNPARMRAAFAHAFGKADIVIATGGLGPTSDDITKDIAAEFFGVPLFFHDETWARIEKRFAALPYPLTENNKRQAMLPQGCEVLPNDHGSAAGAYMEREGKILILLPGPPYELEPMFRTYAVPFLRKKSGVVFLSRTLKTIGIGESAMAERLQDLLNAQTNPTLAPYAHTGEAWLRLTASAPDEEAARKLLKPMADEIYKRLGEDIYGEDEETPASAVLRLLKARGLTLACAESCTGGLLADAFVSVPGASEVFLEGAVTYSNAAKIKRLGVPEVTLREYGAVSPQTAEAMARGVTEMLNADVGLATTGVAGPDGGTADKPIGLVYIGLCVKGKTTGRKLNFSGNRSIIRKRSVKSALDLLRRTLLQESLL